MGGYHQWADGDILQPGDIDEYLMTQTVMRFSNAADRAGQLTSPSDGMRSYLVDSGLEYVYSNGSWAPISQWRRMTAGTQSVTESTDVVDIPTLAVDLSIGVFEIDMHLAVQGAANGDVIVKWDFTGNTLTRSRSCFGPSVRTTDVLATATAATTVGPMRSSALTFDAAAAYGTDGTNTSAIHENLFLQVSTAGTLTPQFAQWVSNATATTLTVQSRVYARRLG
jgi:hypothetical protein